MEGKGDHPAGREVASGWWAPTRLFPLKHTCAHLHWAQLCQSRYATQHSGTALPKKYSLSMLGVLYLCTVLVRRVHCGAVDCSAVHSGHGTGLLSPKQSGMDRPSASECLKGEAAQDKQKQKNKRGI